jgi:hypothetical protein
VLTLLLALLLGAAPVSESDIDIAADRIRQWRRDGVGFVRDMFGVEPDRWQAQALSAFTSDEPRTRRIAMQACAGPGKTAVQAWCGWHFLLCQGDRGHHPVGYALSVTGDNLKDNLWKEFAVWRERAPALQVAFEWTAEKIVARQHPATWWIKARTWPKKADAEAQGRTLSGLHSRYIAYFVDESGDIPPSIQRSAEQGLANCEWGKIVQSGNPTSHDGMLYDAVNNQSDKWTVIRITGDPDDPNRSPRIDIEWAQEQIKAYGRENPWVMAFILGKFPPSSLNALLGPDDVRDAMSRHLRDDAYSWAQKRLGIDVARFGDDRTVIFPRQGLVAFAPVEMRNARSEVIAGRIALAKSKWGSELEFIDDTGGWGAGAIDSARLGGIMLVPINASGKPDDERYFNRRSENAFRAAEWVKSGGCLPNVPGLVKEATAPLYWFEGGKFRVEEKALLKRRIGISPDLWDGFNLTFSMAEMPAAMDMVTGLPMPWNQGGYVNPDVDPFAEARTS